MGAVRLPQKPGKAPGPGHGVVHQKPSLRQAPVPGVVAHHPPGLGQGYPRQAGGLRHLLLREGETGVQEGQKAGLLHAPSLPLEDAQPREAGEESLPEGPVPAFLEEGHHRPPEPCPRELGPQGPGLKGLLHQLVQLGKAHLVVLGQGAVALGHELPEGPGVPPA